MVYGDRGYRGCEVVIVCDSREMRAKRQVVEGVISLIKLFEKRKLPRIAESLYFVHRPTNFSEEAVSYTHLTLPTNSLV